MYQTNEDKLLQSVLKDKQLMDIYGVDPDDYYTITDALGADVPIVKAIAIIIERHEQKVSEKEIYTEVSNQLIRQL